MPNAWTADTMTMDVIENLRNYSETYIHVEVEHDRLLYVAPFG